MKFVCTCGHSISDSTDYLRCKGYFVADQDIYDATEMSAHGSGDWWTKLTRAAYQCSKCQRLWIDNQSGDLVSFVPESPCPNFFSSIHGESWKRVLRGSWTDEPILQGLPCGFLSWSHLKDDEISTHDTWDDLEASYNRVLKLLESKGMLRDALLTKNGQTNHCWPDDVES